MYHAVQDETRPNAVIREAFARRYAKEVREKSMTEDERAIRNLVDTWMSATRASDIETVLNLMADDVIFMVAGQKPFGKEAFAAASRRMTNVRFEGRSNIEELKVLGNWAYLRNYIDMTITPQQGAPAHRAGYT